MILLALESAASACSVAVCDGAGRVLGYRTGARTALQADRLVELIDAALGIAGIAYRDADVIAVNHGPGSFTGVRAGVASARALSLALVRPVIAVNSLEVLAVTIGAQATGTIVAAMDARRGQVYVQMFDHRLAPLDAPSALAPEDVPLDTAKSPLRLVGTGAALLRAALRDAQPVVCESAEPNALGVARRALARLAAGERPRAGRTIQPLYLRPPDARLPTPQMHASAAAGA